MIAATRPRAKNERRGPKPLVASPRLPGPVRSCAGCGERTNPHELLRFILTPEESIAPDLAGSAFGRGAWVHAHPPCLKAAATRGFSRAFKRTLQCEPQTLLSDLAAAGERRVRGLLLAAQRGRKLALGGQAVADALAQTDLALLATDAKAAAKERAIHELAAGGRLVAWGTKELFGDLLGRSDVALVAICDAGIARATAFAISLTKISFDSGDVSRSSTNFPEVR